MVDAHTADTLKAINTFLGKTDGRDKLCATIQYACMFIAAGQPGNSRKIMASVAAARKVFRVLRPLENVTPLLLQPKLVQGQPLHSQVLNKLKSLLNALYFGADHVVWASQAGLITDKTKVERAQKLSLYSWLGASLCTVAGELTEILRMALPAIIVQEQGEDDGKYMARQQAAVDEINKRGLVLFHASIQAFLALGLLGLRPWKPRTVGALGVIASAINCYMLFPPMPKQIKGPAATKVDSKALPVLPPASPQPKIAAKVS
mmetsp:Transcript_19244/g.58089  ORF Transcript_19244/g.58089 Transcript_19244/m.58089 type:complete len:262 (-) Transcript_19244:773-1558(-)